jgi:ribosomal protein S18 acetylase RimI-like enzyme
VRGGMPGIITVVNAIGAIVNREGKVVRGHLDRGTGARRPLFEQVEQLFAQPETDAGDPGENTAMSLIIREATAADIPALAELHVKTWNATYPDVVKKPTYEIRERQWREAFTVADGSWFCFVVVDAIGDLVGFAKGVPYDHSGLPDFAGELSKIYLLRDYHRQGLGRRLLGHVVRRFLSQGITSMLLFAEPSNPSCGFYEALGAERLLDATGRFHGGYGWRDLKSLAAICPIE